MSRHVDTAPPVRGCPTAASGPNGTASRAFTEVWYRLFLRAFPAGHRTEYGAEIIGTLLDGSPRALPRETAGLVTAGFSARARRAAEGSTPWWADGVHLGLLALALANLAYNIGDNASPWWLVVSTALVVALLRGWALAALPLALAVAVTTGRAMLFGSEALRWAPDVLGPAWHNWMSLTPYGLLATGAIVLAARRRQDLRVRPWWWLAIPLAALVLTYTPILREYGDIWQFVRVGMEGGLLLAGVWATAVARSARWALAAAIYTLPEFVPVLNYPPSNAQDIGYRMALAGLLLIMAVTARRQTGVTHL